MLTSHVPSARPADDRVIVKPPLYEKCHIHLAIMQSARPVQRVKNEPNDTRHARTIPFRLI